MREIKFRAWCVGNNWQEFKYFTLDDVIDSTDSFFSQYFRVDVQQFTGLKDKNGREIYEGDILKLVPQGCCYSCNNFKDLIEVKYEYSLLTFLSKERPFATHSCSANWEVIGNIYENPELLEKNEDNKEETKGDV
jgi:uncharacterized phage protein (TIGR01671 family)